MTRSDEINMDWIQGYLTASPGPGEAWEWDEDDNESIVVKILACKTHGAREMLISPEDGGVTIHLWTYADSSLGASRHISTRTEWDLIMFGLGWSIERVDPDEYDEDEDMPKASHDPCEGLTESEAAMVMAARRSLLCIPE